METAPFKSMNRYDTLQEWHITDFCQNEDQEKVSAGYLDAYKSLLSEEIEPKLEMILRKTKTLLWDGRNWYALVWMQTSAVRNGWRTS
jgi:hypothetical protein